MIVKRILAAMLFTMLLPMAAFAENRCGWLVNPTPGNWWLDDADGEWTIMMQGTFEASGMDMIPDMTEREFVPVNRTYGYACFCMNVRTATDNRIIEITSAKQLPLAQCRRDRKLSEHSAG